MPVCRCLDIDIHYQRQGRGQPLLLLHGLGSTSADWQCQLDAFQSEFDVIVPDLPLHGRSGGRREQFSLAHCADTLAALIDTLDLPAVIVVGVSMGGMVGLELAIRHPDKVSALGVVNALAECRPRQWGEWWMLWSRRVLLRYARIDTIATLMAKQLLPGENQRQHRDAAIARWSQNAREDYITAFEALIGWQVLDDLPKLGCPLLVLASEHDYTRTGAKKVLAYLFPKGQYRCLTGAHHLAPLECPQRFNHTLQSWLNTLTP